MKDANLSKWSVILLSLALPLAGGCLQNNSEAPPPVVNVVNPAPTPPPGATVAAVADTNSAVATDAPVEPEIAAEADDALANAPIKEITPGAVPPTAVKTTPAVEEIVKLVNSGVDEAVMAAYVSNSVSRFELNADEIVYLKDIGVPPTIVTAMIERDQALKSAPGFAPAPIPAPTTNQWAPNPAEVAPQATEPAAAAVPAGPPSQVVDNNTFYTSLSPYGRWMEVEGYGMVWQPTVVTVESGWQPYFNSGRWVYTDCGWYWNSDYSWGWAPFHYGRWFRHHRVGWCWAPDVVWGPSWVTWRYSAGYCGWAPLPPSACFRPGIGFTYYGRSVGFSFAFGLGADCYAFVPSAHFYSPHPHHYAVPRERVTRIYQNTTVITRIAGHDNTVINHGIDVGRVSRDTGAPIRRVALRDTATRLPGAGAPRVGGDTRSLPVYRPHVASVPSPVTALSDRPRSGGAPGSVTRTPPTRLVDRNQVTQPSAVQPGGTGHPTTTAPSRPASQPTAGSPAVTRSDRPAARNTPTTTPQRPSTGPVAAPARPTQPARPTYTRPTSPTVTPQHLANDSGVNQPAAPATRSQSVPRNVTAPSAQYQGSSTWPTPQANSVPRSQPAPSTSYQAPTPAARPAPSYQAAPTYQAPAPSFQAPKFQAPAYQAPAPVARPSAPTYQAPAPQSRSAAPEISRPAPAPSYSAPARPSAPANSGNQGSGNRRER